MAAVAALVGVALFIVGEIERQVVARLEATVTLDITRRVTETVTSDVTRAIERRFGSAISTNRESIDANRGSIDIHATKIRELERVVSELQD